MLDDLTNDKRLRSFRAKNNAKLAPYFRHIINSAWFKERWKDWRLGNRIHVPLSVQRISENASKVFYGLYNKESMEVIAQRYQLSLEHVTAIADQIIVVLVRENKLGVLTQSKETSLSSSESNESGENNDSASEIPSFDVDVELENDIHLIQKAWKKLGHVERFVLERMDVEKDSAESVLDCLKAAGVSIKKDVASEETNIQQLYYFRRKARAELVGLYEQEKLDNGFFK